MFESLCRELGALKSGLTVCPLDNEQVGQPEYTVSAEVIDIPDSTLKVAYLSSFYNGRVEGRLGRFHDWVHRLRDMDDPPFEFEVHAFTAVNPDETLYSKPYSILGDGRDLIDKKRNKLEFLLNARRIRRDLRRSDFDLLHVMQLDTIVYPVGVLGRSEPVVVGPDILGWNPLRSGDKWDATGLDTLFPRTKFRVKRVAAITDRYDAATVHSEYHRRMLREVGVTDSKITVLPPGIDPIFRPDDVVRSRDDEVPTLLYVGDFTPYKGFPTLLDAVSHLDQEVRIVALGEGSPEGFDLDAVENLEVVGFVERNELPSYYRAADLFVMPSVDEAGPNTIVEALACGIPVVVTDVPGINEYPPEGTAVYFSPREPGPLAAALEEALASLTQLQRAAMETALGECFHVDRTIERLDILYRNLLGR